MKNTNRHHPPPARSSLLRFYTNRVRSFHTTALYTYFHPRAAQLHISLSLSVLLTTSFIALVAVPRPTKKNPNENRRHTNESSAKKTIPTKQTPKPFLEGENRTSNHEGHCHYYSRSSSHPYKDNTTTTTNVQRSGTAAPGVVSLVGGEEQLSFQSSSTTSAVFCGLLGLIPTRFSHKRRTKNQQPTTAHVAIVCHDNTPVPLSYE
jgi:hypothetical protein